MLAVWTLHSLAKVRAPADDDQWFRLIANGRLVKTNEIVGYDVMQKQAGWGTDSCRQE
jgi:hypothetical protein